MPVELPKLRPPSRHRLVDLVYHSLEDAILSGRMRPGERLVEAWIAEQLQVSRTTVREALLKLEHEGYAVSKPRRGTFVTRLAREDALDLCYSRALLESFAVSSGYASLDAALIDKLEACLERMSVCRLPDDVPTLIQIDLAFHRPLIELGGSRRLAELWSSLNGQIGALFLTSLENQHASIGDVIAFHHQLLSALRSGDAQIAQQAVIDHYVRVEDRDSRRIAQMQQLIGTLAPAHHSDILPYDLKIEDRG
jgi:GntR family transcriptional regulator, rspAB operon transcriptional repressor